MTRRSNNLSQSARHEGGACNFRKEIMARITDLNLTKLGDGKYFLSYLLQHGQRITTVKLLYTEKQLRDFTKDKSKYNEIRNFLANRLAYHDRLKDKIEETQHLLDAEVAGEGRLEQFAIHNNLLKQLTVELDCGI